MQRFVTQIEYIFRLDRTLLNLVCLKVVADENYSIPSVTYLVVQTQMKIMIAHAGIYNNHFCEARAVYFVPISFYSCSNGHFYNLFIIQS